MSKFSRTIPFYISLWVLALALVGCDSGPRSNIERVLKIDNKIGSELAAFAPKKAGEGELDLYAMMIDGSVQEQKAISMSGCPADFASAYRAHIRAWEDFGIAVAKHPKIPSGFEAFVGGFIRGMLGDPTGGLIELDGRLRAWSNEVEKRHEEIVSTWRNVEDIAIREGAKLPRN